MFLKCFVDILSIELSIFIVVPLGFGPKQQMRRIMNFRKDVPGEYIFLEVQLTRVR